MRLRQESCIPSPLQSGFYCQDIRFQHQLILILCLLPVLVVGWNCWTLMRARNSHWPWGRRCSHTLTQRVCSMPSDVTDLTDWKQWVCSHLSFWVWAFVQLCGCQRLTSGVLDCSPRLWGVGSWLQPCRDSTSCSLLDCRFQASCSEGIWVILLFCQMCTSGSCAAGSKLVLSNLHG